MSMTAAALAAAMYSDWTGDTANNGFSSPLSSAQQTIVQSQCNQLAAAIVAQIQADSIHVQYVATGSQSLGNTVFTQINFDTSQSDNSGGAVTNPSTAWLFTVPTGKGGVYMISAGVSIAPAATVSDFIVEVWKNGSETAFARRFSRDQSSAAHTMNVSGAVTMSLIAGDTIQIRAYQNSGAAQNTEVDGFDQWVSITRLVGT